MKELEIAVFEGDGIGPEVMAPTIALLQGMSDAASDYALSFKVLPAGAGHYAKCGDALPAASVISAREADAILLSAMGLPGVRYPDQTEITPQIDLRIALGLYAGVRPVRLRPGQPTPLKTTEPIDFVLIRESTEGLFHSQGRGTVEADHATETLKITRETSDKLFRFCFDLARRRKARGQGPGQVTCVDKANVFRAFAFFRELFDAEAARHPDLMSNHAYVDAASMWMVTDPGRFDVMVTENMFGDILSDLGAGLMGGLGLAPSADIGDDCAIFQPCHGSAPDIAGQGLANPLAMVLSAAMMLDWLGIKTGIGTLCQDAERIENAVDRVLTEGKARSADMGGQATTIDMVMAVGDAMVHG